MWTYSQSSGELKHNGDYVSEGYSGAGDGKNNPAYQYVHDVGPIPQGAWDIAALTVGMTPHGPYVLHLLPKVGTDTRGRAGFLMHGDNQTHTASMGCIIMPRAIRETVWESRDRNLEVVA